MAASGRRLRSQAIISMTSAEAIKQLEQARKTTQSAIQTINTLIVEHEFQDMAQLASQAADTLLEAAILLLRSQDVAALQAMERADDYIERAYEVIDEETDED